MDKLIDDILELVIDDMDCHHEVDHEEDGTHMSVEYSLNNEAELRGKIVALIKKPQITENEVYRKLELALEKIEKLKTQKKGLIADYKYALSKIGASKEVTEEWIEQKAREWIGKNWNDSWTIRGITPARFVQLLGDFAGSLMEEIGK